MWFWDIISNKLGKEYELDFINILKDSEKT